MAFLHVRPRSARVGSFRSQVNTRSRTVLVGVLSLVVAARQDRSAPISLAGIFIVFAKSRASGRAQRRHPLSNSKGGSRARKERTEVARFCLRGSSRVYFGAAKVRIAAGVCVCLRGRNGEPDVTSHSVRKIFAEITVIGGLASPFTDVGICSRAPRRATITISALEHTTHFTSGLAECKSPIDDSPACEGSPAIITSCDRRRSARVAADSSPFLSLSWDYIRP